MASKRHDRNSQLNCHWGVSNHNMPFWGPYYCGKPGNPAIVYYPTAALPYGFTHPSTTDPQPDVSSIVVPHLPKCSWPETPGQNYTHYCQSCYNTSS